MPKSMRKPGPGRLPKSRPGSLPGSMPGSMIVLGLTGSIGMGKSTTAAMFRDLGIPVYDSDAVVHELYRAGAVPIVETLFPGTTKDGVVDRAALSSRVFSNKSELKKLEMAIHPLVQQQRAGFLEDARRQGADMVVLDIPLLFETGGQTQLDGVIVVTASSAEQSRRVLARPGMTRGKFAAILARQIPDAQKRREADFLIDTTAGIEAARQQVVQIIASVRSRLWQPKNPEH